MRSLGIRGMIMLNLPRQRVEDKSFPPRVNENKMSTLVLRRLSLNVTKQQIGYTTKIVDIKEKPFILYVGGADPRRE